MTASEPSLQVTDLSNIYQPLKEDTSDYIVTRALYILPDLTKDGNLRCNLVPWHISRNERHEHLRAYVALSYVWGSETDEISIEVNGKPFVVRSNLHAFLAYVCRQNLCETVYWIDALCINQADIPERNRMVRQMGLIYNKASLAVIWPGLNTDLVRLTTFLDITHDYCKFFSDDYWIYLRLITNGIEMHELEKYCQPYDWKAETWLQNWQELVSNQYWLRAWTQQEIWLASDVQICTERGMTGLQDFWLVSHPVLKYYKLKPDASRNQIPEVTLGNLATDRSLLFGQQPKKRKLYDAISPLYTFVERDDLEPLQCSDARDRIYCQLSRIRRGNTFPVNYSEDSLALFLRALLFSPALLIMFMTIVHVAKALELETHDLYNHLLKAKAQKSLPEDLSAAIDSETTRLRIRIDRAFEWPPNACHTLCAECKNPIKSFDRPAYLTHYCCIDKDFHLSLAPDSESQTESDQLYFHSQVVHGLCDNTRSYYDKKVKIMILHMMTCIWLLQLTDRISHLKLDEAGQTVSLENESDCRVRSHPTIGGSSAIHYSDELVGMRSLAVVNT